MTKIKMMETMFNAYSKYTKEFNDWQDVLESADDKETKELAEYFSTRAWHRKDEIEQLANEMFGVDFFDMFWH